MFIPTGESVDALSFVCHKAKAESMGRKVALQLKNVIDRQNFEINIQVENTRVPVRSSSSSHPPTDSLKFVVYFMT